MSELLKKFFREDLTDDQWDSLGHELEVSFEASTEFLELAERAYAKTGLPTPRFEDRGSKKGKGPLYLALALGALLLGSLLVWALWPPSSQQPPQIVPRPGFQQGETKPPPLKPKRAGQPRQLGARALGSPVYEPRRIRPWTSKKEKEAISVELMLESSALVSARIVDEQDYLVRHLYAGVLQPGHWAFGWDGKLENGRVVSPGKYFIEVKTEGEVQRRVLNIR